MTNTEMIDFNVSENESVLAMQFYLLVLVVCVCFCGYTIYHWWTYGELLELSRYSSAGRLYIGMFVFSFIAVPVCVYQLYRHSKNSVCFRVDHQGIVFLLANEQSIYTGDFFVPWQAFTMIDYHYTKHTGTNGFYFEFNNKNRVPSSITILFKELEMDCKEAASILFDFARQYADVPSPSNFKKAVKGVM